MEGEGHTEMGWEANLHFGQGKGTRLCVASRLVVYRTESDQMANAQHIWNRKFTDILMVTTGLQVACLGRGLACL